MEQENNYSNVGAFHNTQSQSNVYQMQQQMQQQQINNEPMAYNEVLRVTTISDLQSYAAGTTVRFPDFAEGQPFVARVRRPSMLILAKQGKIPNSLLNTAGDLFSKGGSGLDSDNKDMLKDMYDICHVVCESALIQPTLAEIEGSGIELSDDQIQAIFNYTQTGVKALNSFRKK